MQHISQVSSVVQSIVCVHWYIDYYQNNNFYTEAKSIVTSIWKKNIFFSLWVYEFFGGGRGYFVSVIFFEDFNWFQM